LTDINDKVEQLDVLVPSSEDILREQARKNLMELIRHVAPTSNVDVISAPNNTVILSGIAGNAESVQPLLTRPTRRSAPRRLSSTICESKASNRSSSK